MSRLFRARYLVAAALGGLVLLAFPAGASASHTCTVNTPLVQIPPGCLTAEHDTGNTNGTDNHRTDQQNTHQTSDDGLGNRATCTNVESCDIRQTTNNHFHPTRTVVHRAATFRDFDCNDFASQTDAQRVLNSNTSDPHNLDADGDGIACES